MPDPDGLAIARAIRGAPHLAATQLILLTAAGVPMDRSREPNGVVYLSKPIVRSHLLEAIQALHEGHAVDDPQQRPAIERTNLSLRVLVAEDNAMNRKVALGLLMKRGHWVVAVEDGRQALAALEGDSFDVILMDVQMPGMNGLDATTAIRRRGKAKGLPHVPHTQQHRPRRRGAPRARRSFPEGRAPDPRSSSRLGSRPTAGGDGARG